MDLGSDTEDEEEHASVIAHQYQEDVKEHNLRVGTSITTKEQDEERKRITTAMERFAMGLDEDQREQESLKI